MASIAESKPAFKSPENVQIAKGLGLVGGKKDLSNPVADKSSTEYPIAGDGIDRVLGSIRKLGLERHAAELQVQGYTVVEPEKVAPIDVTNRALARVLEIAESRLPLKADLATGLTPTSDELSADQVLASPFGLNLTNILFEDRVFEEVVLNETVEAMTSLCTGVNEVLYSFAAFLKAPGAPPLPLHADHHLPEPHPSACYRCSAIWTLTDFSAENGSTLFIPGSQNLRRQPQASENPENWVSVDAPRGSLIVFHGSLWHGALARQNPGLRVSLHFSFIRHFMHATEGFRGRVPQEILARNPQRFGWLMGEYLHYGLGPEGTDMPQMSRNIKAGEYT